MKRCVQKQISGERPVDRLLDGDLSSSEIDAVERHVGDCSCCSETVHVIHATRDAWQEQPDVQMPQEMQERGKTRFIAGILDDHALNESATAEQRPQWKTVVAFAVAAAFVVAVVSAFYFLSDSPLSSSLSMDSSVANGGDESPANVLPQQVVWEATVLDVRGGDADIESHGTSGHSVVAPQSFKMGTTMTLGEGASVRLAFQKFATVVLGDNAVAELVSRDREKGFALENGSAAVHVDSSALDGMFKVSTPGGEVEVMGTLFWVSVTPSLELTVAVVESSVKVRDPSNPDNVVSVSAGKVLTMNRSTEWSNPTIESIDPKLELQIQNMFQTVPTAMGSHDSKVNRQVPKPSVEKRPSAKRTLSVEQLFVQATTARKKGNINDAAQAYRKIIETGGQAESRAEAAFNLGQMYYSAGNIASSERVLTAHSTLLQKSSFRTMSLFYLAKARCKMGKYSDARPVFDAFFAHSSNHSMAGSMEKLKSSCQKQSL